MKILVQNLGISSFGEGSLTVSVFWPRNFEQNVFLCISEHAVVPEYLTLVVFSSQSLTISSK